MTFHGLGKAGCRRADRSQRDVPCCGCWPPTLPRSPRLPKKYDPARITRFVIDLASAFHRFYGACRILGAEEQVQQAPHCLVPWVSGM